jgi:hypothetical protein
MNTSTYRDYGYNSFLRRKLIEPVIKKRSQDVQKTDMNSSITSEKLAGTLDLTSSIVENLTVTDTSHIDTLKINDINDSNVLHIKWNENASDDRVFNLKVEGGNRTLDMYENLIIGNGYEGTLTFSGSDKTLTVDDDVTTSELIDDSVAPIIISSGQISLDIEDFTVDGLIVNDGHDITFSTTTGTKICTATSQKFAFYNSTPVVQQAEITDELTTITHTDPGTPDYAVQDFVDVEGDGSKGFAFKDKDEANTVLKVIANLQARVNDLETRLVTYGLLPDVD